MDLVTLRGLGGWFVLAFLAWVPTAHSQLDITQWLNPGPLSDPHATLEGVTKCTTCHASAKGVPDEKCLSCHTEIQTLLAARKGYHARQTQTCVACHGEHKGRNFDVTGLTRLSFDHRDTGWPLNGGHAPVKCEACHKTVRTNIETKRPTTRRTYIGAPTECSSCHADPHQGKPEFLKCDKCHTVNKWKDLRGRLSFDHNRESRYPLTGKHARVNCYSCHKQKAWAPLTFGKCTDCHADPHKGQYGPVCEKCHTTNTWKGATPQGMSGKGAFDHDKTAFKLTGQHREVTCLRCHGSKIGKMPGFEQCSGCHNNPHGNQFKELWKTQKDCDGCHLTDGWNILNFQHNRDSRYELKDKHTIVPCEQCHIDRRYRWLQKAPDCDTCHLDVHRGQFQSACATCHTQKGFRELVFDHNKNASFPLVGKHKNVRCESCHQEGRYKGVDHACQSCHNDFHNGKLGQECTRCHAPTAYNDIEFDHNRGSRFRLDGKHVRVPCNQCHMNYVYKFPNSQCSSCHEDVHKGAFGPACERCHTTEGFTTKAGFHDFGEFTLGGAHDRVDCLTCHGPKAEVRIQPSQCSSCHRDPHMNSFGNQCWTCHGQNAWLPSTFRHNQTGFELSGAHRFLSCNQCHFNRVFGGLPSDCLFCHRKDFVPKSVVPQHPDVASDCRTCHFTFGWQPAR